MTYVVVINHHLDDVAGLDEEGVGLVASEIIEGDREVISNSRWGTGGFKTGRPVIPRMIIRRHVLLVSSVQQEARGRRYTL